ncbi:MAG: hypothetical protein KDA84_19450 [Planctomycetaceae bacterium]|nr:hypothetical protein [Planctomycetaceae bacterium]
MTWYVDTSGGDLWVADYQAQTREKAIELGHILCCLEGVEGFRIGQKGVMGLVDVEVFAMPEGEWEGEDDVFEGDFDDEDDDPWWDDDDDDFEDDEDDDFDRYSPRRDGFDSGDWV